MLPSQNVRTLLLCGSALCVASLATSAANGGSFVDAQTFECERVWPAPSANNSLVGCLVNVSHLATLFDTNAERAEIGAAIIPLAIAVVTALVFPVFLALRYCVDFCGSNKRRPTNCCYGGEEWDHVPDEVKDRFYDPQDAAIVRVMAYVTLFVSFCPMVLLLVGSGDLQTGYNSIFQEAYSIVGWAETKEREIRGLVQSNGTFVGSINQSFVDDLRAAIAGYKADLVTLNDVNTGFLSVIKTVAIIFALLPMVSICANACFAAYDVRVCWPLLNSFFHFIFLILYAFIASAALLLGVLTTRICGERNTFLAGEPSIASYYAVPLCQSSLTFAPVQAALAAARGNTSVAACLQLQANCNQASSIYSPATPERIFYCPGLTDPSTQCLSSSSAAAVIQDTSVVPLTGVPFTCDPPPGRVCGVRVCTEACSTQDSRKISVDIELRKKQAIDINRASDTFTTEVGNCTALIRKAFTELKSCSVLKSSVFFVGVGSTIFTGLFLIGFFTIFLGQKRFFKPLPVETDDSSPARTPQTKSIEPIN